MNQVTTPEEEQQWQEYEEKPYAVIHFEDKGQDFIKWTVSKSGAVLGSEPFQSEIWTKYRVKNLRGVNPGDIINIENTQIEGVELPIIYPVEQIDFNVKI